MKFNNDINLKMLQFVSNVKLMLDNKDKQGTITFEESLVCLEAHSIINKIESLNSEES